MTSMILVRAFLEMIWGHLRDSGPAGLVRLFARRDCPVSLLVYVLVGCAVGICMLVKLVARILEAVSLDWLYSLACGLAHQMHPLTAASLGGAVLASALVQACGAEKRGA